MLVQWSVVAWKHYWDAQWWRWRKSDIQSVWNCTNILLATLRKHLSQQKTSCLSSTFAPLLVETTPSIVTLLVKLQKNFTKCKVSSSDGCGPFQMEWPHFRSEIHSSKNIQVRKQIIISTGTANIHMPIWLFLQKKIGDGRMSFRWFDTEEIFKPLAIN